MLKPVINKYNNIIRSTVQMKPAHAHKDDYRLEVKQNIELKAYYKITYPNISVGDQVKTYTKGRDTCSSRKQTVSTWAALTYEVIKITARKGDILIFKMFTYYI